MILTNGLGGIATASVLRQLDSNLKKSLKNAAEISSGKKINSAKDDPSGYHISEEMKKQIRSLDQCNDNSKKGQTMIDTASGGIDQQIAIMRNLKKLALDAANDSNSPADRKIIQEHANQLFAESENIAQTTQYNGQYLLNKSSFSREDTSFNPNTPYRAIPNSTPVLQQAAANGGSYTPAQGHYTAITISPIANTYDPASVGKGTTLTSLPTAGDIVWDNNNNTYGRVTLNSTDNALYISSAAGDTLIEVNGTTNGSYPAAASTNVSTIADYPANTTAPAIGDTVAASATPSFDNNTPPNITTNAYTVATEPGTNALSYFTPDGSTSIISLDFSNLFSTITNVPGDLNGLGFSFDCSGCNQYVTVMFDSSTASSRLYGSTDPSTDEAICYKIGVQNVTDSHSLLETVFNGITAANARNSNDFLPNSNNSTTEIAGRHNIELNYYAPNQFTISKDGPTATFNNGIEGSLETTDYYKPSQTLSLQTGTSSSQYTNVKIPNTTLAALFPDYSDQWDNEPQESDYPNPWPKEYTDLSDTEKKSKWRKEVWPYPTDNTQNLSTTFLTRENAGKFIDTADQSLKYLIHSSTVTGAESNRLNYTEDNLTTASTNTTASMSTITDTNIAKAMTEYTKNNVLSQATQAMLTHANSNASNILSLLQ